MLIAQPFFRRKLGRQDEFTRLERVPVVVQTNEDRPVCADALNATSRGYIDVPVIESPACRVAPVGSVPAQVISPARANEGGGMEDKLLTARLGGVEKPDGFPTPCPRCGGDAPR